MYLTIAIGYCILHDKFSLANAGYVKTHITILINPISFPYLMLILFVKPALSSLLSFSLVVKPKRLFVCLQKAKRGYFGIFNISFLQKYRKNGKNLFLQAMILPPWCIPNNFVVKLFQKGDYLCQRRLFLPNHTLSSEMPKLETFCLQKQKVSAEIFGRKAPFRLTTNFLSVLQLQRCITVVVKKYVHSFRQWCAYHKILNLYQFDDKFSLANWRQILHSQHPLFHALVQGVDQDAHLLGNILVLLGNVKRVEKFRVTEESHDVLNSVDKRVISKVNFCSGVNY